jgi:hypothetical protein
MTRQQRAERWRRHERDWLRKLAVARRFERVFKADANDEDETDDDETNDGDDDGDRRHLVDQLADLIAEGGAADGEISRRDALRWLLHTERGQALVARTKRTTMTTPVLKIAKALADAGRSFVTEHDLTKMIEQHALRDRRDGETPEQAFARVFAADDAEGRLFRKAIAICKQAPLQIDPLQVGGDDATDSDDPEAALAELRRLADDQRRRSPELTSEQAFGRVFADPANAALAARAHRRPTANAKNAFPFPR